uniref:ATP synthase F0 subunit 6 n=1 Tax=Sirsoe methanicola TaxID=378374 RepID=UPI002036BC12|nr:ATP synthase F0 subunit 6 [Sirsoe methanicola]UQV94837.1 ATP synthase F0 subunit 6 [Sirsoe methanicola]
MMMDIFSSFDPFTNSLYQISPTIFWMTSAMAITPLHASYWLSPSKTLSISSYPLEIMSSQTGRTFGGHLKSFSTIITALFIFLIVTNLIGLIPYTFSMSTHLIMTLSLGLPLWLSLIMSSALHAPMSFTAGLLPGGAPNWLNPFLVIIETLSISVRPITLSFRLAANLTAGHIILGLIGIYTSAAIFNSPTSFLILLSIQTLYILFEVGICLIQAYIFCLLLTLYADEHPSH